jgi:hypothetical protein
MPMMVLQELRSTAAVIPQIRNDIFIENLDTPNRRSCKRILYGILDYSPDLKEMCGLRVI